MHPDTSIDTNLENATLLRLARNPLLALIYYSHSALDLASQRQKVTSIWSSCSRAQFIHVSFFIHLRQRLKKSPDSC